jgi:hypothetical protein
MQLCRGFWAQAATSIDDLITGKPRVVQPKYRAFLSYSHRDAKWADWLHKALESYRTPKRLVGSTTPRGPVAKRLTPIFRDRE